MNLIHALGWTLIHFLWEGAAIALCLALALYVFRPSSARLRYGLGCLAMLTMAAAFLWTLAHLWPGLPAMARDYSPRLLSVTPPPAPRPGAGLPGETSDGRLRWMVLFWIAGVCAFSLRSLLSWMAARRLRQIGVCLAPDPWQRTLRRLAATLGLARPLLLFESALAEVPVVIGVLRPVILLPAGLLANLPAEQLEYFLLHELAHIRRYDYLVNLLQSFMEDLLFYHPAVWWVSRLIREERENCCDDLVLTLGNARDYAAALVALEQKRGPVTTVLAANGGQLMPRIQRLLIPETRRRAKSPFTAASLIAGSLLLASAAIAIPHSLLPPPPPVSAAVPTPAVRRTPEAVAPIPRKPLPMLLAQARQDTAPEPLAADPYMKWLEEEVPYIITAAEHTAFLGLRTDAERNEFIDQFWQRRDPTAGTPENEFKEEHYRRIAAANQHFTAGTAGWRTDRGRIYITFGPPDEIDSHPTGSINVPPWEDWRYRYLEGIGRDVDIRFVDAARNGTYRMTTDPAGTDKPEARTTPRFP